MHRFIAAFALWQASMCTADAGEDAQWITVDGPLAELPPAWSSAGPAPREHLLELTFAVRQRGRQELLDTLLRVSDPKSEDYGLHLTLDEVNAMTAPAAMDLQAVLDFLESHGASPKRATPNGDMVTAVMSVTSAERMLSARYEELVHTSGAKRIRAPSGYKLPSRIADAIDFVSPTTHIPGVRGRAASTAAVVELNNNSDPEALWNTPLNLRRLYSIGDVEGQAAGNRQAVTAFLEQDYRASSLHVFWKMFCRKITCGKGDPKLVGDATVGTPGVESMLDIETVTGVAGNVEAEFWGFSGRAPQSPENEPFMKWLEQLSNTADDVVPKVFSTSYGEDESSWPRPAAERLNVEFQKAGVRGISLLFASGDSGANCERGRFVPNGPATSPYVTAVGGTGSTAQWPAPGGEKASGLSSGGFSDYWPMPPWQKDATQEYLQQSGLPDPSAGYNSSGRGYPDIAAQAEHFYVQAAGPNPDVAGTSCASPAAAGIFALLNDLRMQQGKSTLGFLNPLIYAHTTAFTDITLGTSMGGCTMGRKGWPAKPGWDAATGVGTPNYEALAEVVMALPAGRDHASAANSVIAI